MYSRYKFVFILDFCSFTQAQKHICMHPNQYFVDVPLSKLHLDQINKLLH